MNELLDPLLLARWQFGLTTIYHFLFVPITIGLATTDGGLPDRVVPHRQDRVPPHHALLRHDLPHQLRDGRRHGHRAGVPVRHELVGVLPVRRRRLRRPARDGGPARVLLRGHVHRPLDLRLGQAAARPAPRHHLGGRDRQHRLGVLHHRGERVHAEPRRLRDERRRRAAPSSSTSGRCSPNPVALAAFPHTIAASFMVAAGLIISAAAWHLARNQHLDTMRPALKFGLWTMVGAGILTTLFGDQLSLAMVATQPMKMAAAEARTTRSAARLPRSRSSPSARPTARPSCSRSACPTCCRSSRRTRSTAASRASTTCRRSTRSCTAPATTRRSSGSRTGRSAG